MQNAVIGIIVGATFLGLMVVAVRSRRSGHGATGLQLALGAVVGALAAATAVSVRADLVPDDIESTVAAVVVLLAVVSIILVLVRHHVR